jgi:D-glycero-alpha-D-manno-heptose-7-phosphate kinase
MAPRVIRSRAPLRLGLAGGGTDLSPYCDQFGGAVLNATIDRYAHASLTPIEGRELILRADDLDVTEECPTDAVSCAGPLALHRGVYRRVVDEFLGGRGPALSIHTMIDAPPGSGLGSSSALVVALVEAFRIAFDLPLGRYDVARLAFEIERKDLGLAGGRQDQYAATFGGVNFIEFLPDERVIVNPLRLQAAADFEIQSSLVVCFTGQSRASHDIIEDQVRHIAAKDQAAMEGMRQLKEDAFDMKRALLVGDLTSVATIMNRSWLAKKATASQISNTEIETLWNVAMGNGAMGGKVSGAGGGGFLMFLCDPHARASLMRALRKAGGHPDTVSFSAEGALGWVRPG